jgi:hypothetical protein
MLKSPIITRKTVNIIPTGTERRKEPCFQVVRPPPVYFLFSLFLAVGLPKFPAPNHPLAWKTILLLLCVFRIILNTNEHATGGDPMSKTVTIRLSEEEYILFAQAAEAVKRPISNLINYLAKQKLEEDLFVDQIEMDEILGKKNLVESMRKGSKDAKLRKGVLVDV